MTAKHTPGPWIFYADLPSAEPNWHIVTTANKMRVLANVHIEPGNAIDLANAHLIAAAPELLAVLECTTATLEAVHKRLSGGQAHMVYVQIQANRATLAKARGES